MIPRRRIDILPSDLADWLRTPFVASRQAAADVRTFEHSVADFVGVRHARAVASGRDALALILDGLGLRPGDEVVIPGYTLGELVLLLQRKGLELAPADVDRSTFNVTPATVAARVGPTTRAVLAVHMFGAPCDIRGICRVADRANVPVIEDCAHALGATIEGQPVGSFGRAALFSLEAAKPVSALGGGVIATNDDALAQEIDYVLRARSRREWPALRKALMKYGEEVVVRSPLYGPLAKRLFSEKHSGTFDAFYRRTGDRVRSASGFSGYQARVALRKLGQVVARNAKLDEAWEAVARRLPPCFTAQRRKEFGAPAFYQFVALFHGDLRRLRAAALGRGLDLGIGSEIMSDTARLLGRDDCPGAAHVEAHAVQIPLYESIGEARLERVIDRLSQSIGDLP